MKKIIKHRLDLANLPRLTAEQKAELTALAALPDNHIDTTDIPSTTEEARKNATRGRFYKPARVLAKMEKRANPRSGTTFDSFLKREGIHNEVYANARKRVRAEVAEDAKAAAKCVKAAKVNSKSTNA